MTNADGIYYLLNTVLYYIYYLLWESFPNFMKYFRKVAIPILKENCQKRVHKKKILAFNISKIKKFSSIGYTWPQDLNWTNRRRSYVCLINVVTSGYSTTDECTIKKWLIPPNIQKIIIRRNQWHFLIGKLIENRLVLHNYKNG